MLNSHITRYITKMIQVLMHLRIDVKKDQTQHFQALLARKKKSQPIKNTVDQFFDFIITEDLYDVGKKVIDKNQTGIYTIKVTFTFVNKTTQCTQLAEAWYLTFKEADSNSPQSQKQSISSLETAFYQFVTFLVKLPLWDKFWGNFEKRKEIKKQYTLVYRIQYNKSPGNYCFQYNRKVEKQLMALGISTTVVVQHRTDFMKLFSCIKEDIQKTIIIKEQYPRKKSLYEFYDQQFDITFVSSDSELSTIPNKEVKVVGTVNQQSDEEYEIIIDQNADIGVMTFKRGLRQISEQVDIVMQKYF